jgi:hypothetical protein
MNLKQRRHLAEIFTAKKIYFSAAACKTFLADHCVHGIADAVTTVLPFFAKVDYQSENFNFLHL